MEVVGMKRASTLVLALTLGFSSVLGGCNTAGKVKRTLALNDLQIKAGIAEDEGNWEQAYEHWTEYVERRPHSAHAEYRLGVVEMRLGKYRDAVGHLRVAHDLQPGNIETIEALAGALVAVGDTEALLRMLRQSVNEGPEGSGYLRLGQYAAEAGMLDEAREAYTLAIVNGRGESAEPYIAMADFARMVGDEDAEVRNLRYALWFDKNSVVIGDRLRGLGMIPGPSLALKPEF